MDDHAIKSARMRRDADGEANTVLRAEGNFALNKSYLREQAKEAIVTFAIPVLGLAAAITGASVIGVGRAALRGGVSKTK